MKKILAFYPNGYKDTMTGLISEGLKENKKFQIFEYDYATKKLYRK